MSSNLMSEKYFVGNVIMRAFNFSFYTYWDIRIENCSALVVSDLVIVLLKLIEIEKYWKDLSTDTISRLGWYARGYCRTEDLLSLNVSLNGCFHVIRNEDKDDSCS